MSGATRWLIDGQPDARPAADDRGLLYGDGVFRTLRAVDGEPWLLEDHLLLLLEQAGRIALPATLFPAARLAAEARALAAGDTGILRITLTRGSGPRGYAMPTLAQGCRILAFTPCALPSFAAAPVLLQCARTPVAVSPALAGIKHLGRLEQALAASEPAGDDVFERLMCDSRGAFICGTRSNLFLRLGRRLLSPDLTRSGVAGLMRSLILTRRLGDLDALVDDIATARIDLDMLRAADEVFISNAVIGIRAVAALNDVRGERVARWQAPGAVAAAITRALVADEVATTSPSADAAR